MNKIDMDFIIEVTVDITLPKSARDEGKYVSNFKVMVAYDVDIEYRSWGIKNMTPMLQRELVIYYFENDRSDNEVEKSITVLPNDLKREFVRSVAGFGCPETIELYIKEDGTVDYEMSTITFWMAES